MPIQLAVLIRSSFIYHVVAFHHLHFPSNFTNIPLARYPPSIHPPIHPATSPSRSDRVIPENSAHIPELECGFREAPKSMCFLVVSVSFTSALLGIIKGDSESSGRRSSFLSCRSCVLRVAGAAESAYLVIKQTTQLEKCYSEHHVVA